MRVIKFRGKRIDNGEWVYGCCGYGFDQVVGYIMPNMGGFIAVDSSTVGQ